MMKRIISAILCIAVAVTCFGSFALAEEAVVREDYVIRAQSGKALTVSADGNGLTLADSDGGRAQRWRFTEDGTIYNRINNRAITVDGGVVLSANKREDNQKWEVDGGMIKYSGGGYLTIDQDDDIVISDTGTVWEIEPWQSTSESEPEEAAGEVNVGGTMVIMNDNGVLAYDPDSAQLTVKPYEMGNKYLLWDFVKSGEGYNIINISEKNYIDVSGNSRNPGGSLILWRGTGGDNQRWIVEGGGYIKSVFSGLYMNEKDGRITQENKADAVRWKLLSLDEINVESLKESGNSPIFENNRKLLENMNVISKDREYSEKAFVTNRDAVTMAVKLFAWGNDYGAADTDFADVDKNDAVSGYVAQALIMNLIDQKVNFYPDNAQDGQEFVKMMVRGLGYDQAVGESGYMKIASSQKLTKGVSVFEDGMMTYAQAFKIMVNTLSAQVLEFKSLNEGFMGDTLLENYGITVLKKARIDEVSYTDKKLWVETENEVVEFDLPGNYENTELKGLKADVWVDGDNNVVSIDVYSSLNIKYGYITAVNGFSDRDAEFNPDSVKTININNEDEDYNIPDSAKMEIDGSENYRTSVKLIDAFVRMTYNGKRAESIEIYHLTRGGLFESYNGTDITYMSGAVPNSKLSGVSNRSSVKVVLNNKPATVESIPKNAVFDFCSMGDELYITAFVNLAYGTFGGAGDDYFTIGEEDYDLAEYVFYSSDNGKKYSQDRSLIESFYNNRVTAYLDGCGRVRYIRGEENTDSIIGIVTDIETGGFNSVTSISVWANIGGAYGTKKYKLDLAKRSEVTKDDLVKLSKSGTRDNAVFEFNISDDTVTKITNLDWVSASDTSKGWVSQGVKNALIEDYGEERVEELFADKKMFVTGWCMGRDYGLTRIHFNAQTDSGEDYTLMTSGWNTKYIMAYDSEDEFRPREISWYDYRNTNFDKSFLRVGFLKDNRDRLNPDIVYILSSNKYVAVSSWDVHGIVKKISEIPDGKYSIELVEPNNLGKYTIESEEDLAGEWDGKVPKTGDVVTLNVRGTYDKVYYNSYGEVISEDDAAILEEDGEYVELKEEYRPNGFATVVKTWDLENEIGRYNNDYTITYVDNIYKIAGNLMYYEDEKTGQIIPYYSQSGSLFIIEDPTKYIMYEYEDVERKIFDDPLTLDDVHTEEFGGMSDKLLIFSVSRGRYPKIIIRMPEDWEP